MDATVDFWDRDEHWMVLIDAAKLMIIAIPQQVAFFTQNILFLTFGSVIGGSLYVVRN